MRILYIANIRFPTEKAHGVQIAKMCEAFADLGHDVELAVTDRATDITDDPFTYYGVRRNFTLTRISVPDIVSWGAIGFLIESIVFGMRAARYAKKKAPELLFGRDEIALYFASKQIIWETHTGAWNFFARALARRAHRIIAISQGLKDFYIERGIPADRIVVAHDGIDLEQFAHPQSKAESRARLGLPQDAKIAMYIGRLDGWKGTDTLLEASKLLSDVLTVVIGGEPQQIESLAARYPQVRFLGYHPYTELADNQAAADVLMLPNTGKDPISAKFTSPLKLFSYMASGRPIVASDLPSIREVVDEQSALLVPADNPQALADCILRALDGGGTIAEAARACVQQYSWRERASVILRAAV